MQQHQQRRATKSHPYSREDPCNLGDQQLRGAPAEPNTRNMMEFVALL